MTTSNLPIPYSDDVETIPYDEAVDIQQIVQVVERVLTKSRSERGKHQGEVHVKAHGFAEGELRILPNLPPELAQGLFAQSQTYPVIVRFSNSAGQAQSDAIPDGRGMAIKVRGPQGVWLNEAENSERSQDFLMINHPVFFATNVKDYLRLQRVLAAEEPNSFVKFGSFLTSGDWNPLNWHWKELLNAARIVAKLPMHPASTTYFSMTAFRFGNFVAKYRVRPVGDRQDSLPDLIKLLGTKVDALRLALEQTLRTQELLFEFQVQLRNSAATMPVEDPTIEWPETESRFRTVAHLLLPRQDIELLRGKDEYNNLSFNVWHALAAHRPLGGINRVRRPVYAVSSAWRSDAPQ